MSLFNLPSPKSEISTLPQGAGKHARLMMVRRTHPTYYHLGKRNKNEDFQKSADYLKDKFKIKRIPSTYKN